MRKEQIEEELSNLAFDFFYWFSRFEFALKENGYLKDSTADATAEPGWNGFVSTWQDQYTLTDSAKILLDAPPKRQVVGPGKSLTWKTIGLGDCRSDLERVVRLLKTVRNNLFHGGKHGDDGWDNPVRIEKLLTSGRLVLDELAYMSGLEADYTRHY